MDCSACTSTYVPTLPSLPALPLQSYHYGKRPAAKPHSPISTITTDRENPSALRQIQDECTLDLLFEVVILTLERSEGEGSLYFVFVLSHRRQGTPTLILL